MSSIEIVTAALAGKRRRALGDARRVGACDMMPRMKRALALAAIVACGGKHDAPKVTPSDATVTNADPAKSDAAKVGVGSGSAGSAAAPATPPDQEPTSPPPPPTVVPQTKGDCKTEYAPKPTRDPNPMCKVDGGTFLMGEKEKVPTKLSPYYIDEFEVTNAQFAFFLNATHGDPECVHHMPDGSLADGTMVECFTVAGPDGGRENDELIRRLADGRFVVEPGTEHLPFERTRREGAADYCRWVGKQLPTQAQWEFAARHDPKTGKDLIFPWGDRFEGQRARCDIKVCPDAPGLDPKYRDEPVAVGTYGGANGRGDGRSPWGVFEMAGNADEMIVDCQHDLKPCDGGLCTDPSVTKPLLWGDELNPPSIQCGFVTLGGSLGGERQLHVGAVTNTQGEAGFRCVRSVP